MASNIVVNRVQCDTTIKHNDLPPPPVLQQATNVILLWSISTSAISMLEV